MQDFNRKVELYLVFIAPDFLVGQQITFYLTPGNAGWFISFYCDSFNT